jgi:ppGpp synthetase/RelA/SpoT-type nucleotidyltranferase
MVVPSSVAQTYAHWRPFVDEVERRVSDVLRQFAAEHGFIFEGRSKTLESLAEKIETGRFKSWGELDDLYACTIAVPLIQDEDTVLNFLVRKFDTIELKKRGEIAKPPDTFRFDSTRLIARLRPQVGAAAGSAEPLFSVRFEIQVKTLFELAWAKTTHALVYKSSIVDWRRQRLVAHLKATAEQADFLLAGFDKVADTIGGGFAPDVNDKAAIRDAFVALLQDGRIPTEVAPKDWTRFSENVYRVIQVLSNERPSGRSMRPLSRLGNALTIVRDSISALAPEQFPRSISLFQYTTAVLASSGQFRAGRFDYYLPTTPELMDLFPELSLAWEPFTFD